MHMQIKSETKNKHKNKKDETKKKQRVARSGRPGKNKFQVCVCVRWAVLANAGGPCEIMLMLERIEGEALQTLLRYCIELVSWAAPWKDVRA